MAGRLAIGCAVTLLTLYAAALRADVLVTRLGPAGDSRLARLVERVAAPVGAALRPRSVVWHYTTTPYTGDPINYIRFAREMQGFYQPHVREPVFLALTRGFLHLLNDRDIAVSYASAFASSLVVPATYLLGTAAFGPAVGLIAAAGWAIEFEAISWSADGWRDDTFTLFFTLSAWAYVRLRQSASPDAAVIAGVAAAGACLTRLSSLLFVTAGLIWIVAEPATSPRSRRVGPPSPRLRRARMAAVAAAVTAILVGPYLVSCWIATGDPFYAVNYHTRYYRAAEGLRGSMPESATQFVARQFTTHPITTVDRATGGLLTWPFKTKWHGFDPWSPHLTIVMQWSAAIGLILFMWPASGRLLLVLLFAALAPYALTYTLGGGGAWRFSEHIYPIYLTAAGYTLVRAIRAATTAVRERAVRHPWRPHVTRRRIAAATLIASVAVVVWIAYYTFPLLIVREALGEPGGEVTILAGSRERLFFVGPWSTPQRTGVVVVRVAEGTETGMRFPLRQPMPLRVTLKMDPAETADPARQPTVTVFLNRQRLGDVQFTRDRARMGTYRFAVASGQTRRGINTLQLVSSHTVPARDSGRPFAWLTRDTPVAFRLWYLRLVANTE